MKNFKNLIYLSAALLFLSACASEKALYRGQFLNGVPHGTGSKYWPDGTKYKGSWFNGQYSGAGVITWPDKSHYEGNFSNDKRD